MGSPLIYLPCSGNKAIAVHIAGVVKPALFQEVREEAWHTIFPVEKARPGGRYCSE